MDDAGDALEGAREEVEELAGDAGEVIGDGAGEIADGAGDLTQDAVDGAENLVDDAGDAIDGVVQDIQYPHADEYANLQGLEDGLYLRDADYSGVTWSGTRQDGHQGEEVTRIADHHGYSLDSSIMFFGRRLILCGIRWRWFRWSYSWWFCRRIYV